MVLCFVCVLTLLPPVGIKLPTEVTAPPGRIVALKAETQGEVVRWASLADGVDLIPFPDGKTALFCSPTPGRFTVLAWTASGNIPSEAARVVVVVGTAPPPPPVPGDFARELRALVQAESDADALKRLAGAYRAASEVATKSEVATAGQLAGRVRDLVRAAVPAESLVAVRKRLARESAVRLPAEADNALTAKLRESATLLFTEFATILEGK